MNISGERYKRILALAFLVCIFIILTLVVYRLFIPSIIEKSWELYNKKWFLKAEDLINEKFKAHLNKLLQVGIKISNDTLFQTELNQVNPETLKIIFGFLQKYQLSEEVSIELLNQSGNTIAWCGKSSIADYTVFNEKEKKVITLSEKGLKTYLNVGIKLEPSNAWIVLSEPIELDYLFSKDSIQEISLSKDISNILGTNVVVKKPGTYKLKPDEISIQIKSEDGEAVADFVVKSLKVDDLISRKLRENSRFIAIFVFFASILLFLQIFLYSSQESEASRAFALIFILWFVRILWLKFKFPSIVFNSQIFDSNLFNSRFAFGLASTLGDLIISSVFVSVSLWIIFCSVFWNERWTNSSKKLVSRLNNLAVLCIFVFTVFLTLWLSRGFNEALRSFAFDSNILYDNPANFLPDFNNMSLHIGILLLGFSLVCTVMIFVKFVQDVISKNFDLKNYKVQILFLTLFLLSIYIFEVVDRSSISLILFFIVLVLLSCFTIWLLNRWSKKSINLNAIKIRSIVILLLVSYVLSMPILHEKIEQRQKVDVNLMLAEFMRPKDSSHINAVQEALKTSCNLLNNEMGIDSIIYAKDRSLAFLLWNKTVLGIQGYNSAIIIYDAKGEEVDRFVMGISKEELKEILTKVFDGEEELVHIVSKSETKSLNDLYGAWSVIRSEDNRILGAIAIVLSGIQKNIFEREVDPLKLFESRIPYKLVREIAIHEFRGNNLIFSTGKKLYVSNFPISKDEIKLLDERGYLWKNISINGYETETIFRRDPYTPDRIVAISMENLDARWYLFGYVKEFFAYIMILVILGVYYVLVNIRKIKSINFGIGQKLLLAYSMVILLSLIILSYYDRRLVIDRLKQQYESELFQQLDYTGKRISSYVYDEEDFLMGVDDDFCEALASEYGVDFSVYHDKYLQASSMPELYQAGFLDDRISDKSFLNIVLGNEQYVFSAERIGSVEYLVGYGKISINGKLLGIISIPTISKQAQIEAEIAQRNAYVLSIYVIVFTVTLLLGSYIIIRFTRPLKILRDAANEIAQGNLDINVNIPSRDEVGHLAESFNEMATKLKISREELARNEREKAWREMAKQVAHEIRNPLTPIKLSIQHLRQAFKDKVTNLEEVVDSVTCMVIEHIETLSRIATEFSRFAKMPEGKYERVSINELLKETVNLFKEVEGISFAESYCDNDIAFVGDKDQLRSVFVNIVRNAVQAIENEGIITIETYRMKKVGIIKIKDTGAGIPENIRERIFEPNFSTKTEGMGLGLAIAKRIVENYGGTIDCISEVGKGTIFEIKFPL